jgi:hypothetical protein
LESGLGANPHEFESRILRHGNCALTRAYAPFGLRLEPQAPDFVRYLCAIFAAVASVEDSEGRSGSAASDDFAQFD